MLLLNVTRGHIPFLHYFQIMSKTTFFFTVTCLYR